MTTLYKQKPFKIFRRIQLDQVVAVSLVRGMGKDERHVTGPKAKEVAEVLLGLMSPRYTRYDRIQPFTWDFKNNKPLKYTPSKWFICIKEQDHNVQRYTSLGCFEVGDEEVYDCQRSEGSVERYMAWHYNSMELEKDYIDSILQELMDETFTINNSWNFIGFIIGLIRKCFRARKSNSG